MSTQQLQSSRSCSCGRRLQNFSTRPMSSVCACGEPYELAGNPNSGAIVSERTEWVTAETQPVCTYRDHERCRTSCGCGVIYRCNLLDKFCADAPLAVPLYEINVVKRDGSPGQMLSKNYQSDSRAVSENFHACSECDFNSNKLKAMADLDSASKN